MTTVHLDTTLAVLAVLFSATGPIVPSLAKWCRARFKKGNTVAESPGVPERTAPNPEAGPARPAAEKAPPLSPKSFLLILGLLAVPASLSSIAFPRTPTEIVFPSLTSGAIVARIHILSFLLGCAVAGFLFWRGVRCSIIAATAALVAADVVVFMPLAAWLRLPSSISFDTGGLALLAFVFWMGCLFRLNVSANRSVTKYAVVVGLINGSILLFTNQVVDAVTLMMLVSVGLWLNNRLSFSRLAVFPAIVSVYAIALVLVRTPYYISKLEAFLNIGGSNLSDSWQWEHVVTVSALAGAVPFGPGSGTEGSLIPEPYSTDALMNLAVAVGVVPAIIAFGSVVYVGFRMARSADSCTRLIGAMVLLLALVNAGNILGLNPVVYAVFPTISYDTVVTFVLPIAVAIAANGPSTAGTELLLDQSRRLGFDRLLAAARMRSITIAELLGLIERLPYKVSDGPEISSAPSPSTGTAVYRHGSCPIKHRSKESAARCRRR